jgi:hypothetical protein
VQSLQIEARAKRLACATKNNHPAAIRDRTFQRGDQLVLHLKRHRVAAFGTVERDGPCTRIIRNGNRAAQFDSPTCVEFVA